MNTRRYIAICTVPAIIAGALLFTTAARVGAQSTPARAQAVPAAAAATPAPASLEAILKQVASYDGGIESTPMWWLRDYVYARKDDAAGRAECETKLLAFVKSPASPFARMAAARYLRLIAGDTAVATLQPMIGDEKSADLALYALQGIPGAAAEKALLQALGATTGPTKLAVITALGERRSAAAVPAIAPLLQQAALAPTAAVALGRIGGAAAVTPLTAALPAASAPMKTVLAGALLEAASGLLAAKNTQAAMPVYDALAADTALPWPQRHAATLGRIDAAGSGARTLITTLIAGSDAVAQQAAISRVATTFTADAIAPVCALLPKISDGAQIGLMAALTGYPAGQVVPSFLAAAKSPTEAVRIAAIGALAQTGGPAQVAFLADRAANAKGVEQTAARTALASLKGRPVDDEILAQFSRKPADPIAGELLLAIGERRIFPAKSIVVSAMTSSSPVIRRQAYRGLRTIGTPSDIPAVIDAMLATDNESEQSEAEKTVLALAQKVDSLDGRARMVRTRYTAQAPEAVRVRLIALFGLIGDPSTLPVLRSALNDSSADIYDAAVRALAAWPTAAAREDLMALARDARAESHRLLAIRGLVRVIGLDRYRDPRAAVEDLQMAAGFAWRPDEYRLVLSGLAQFPCQESLDMAKGFLRQDDVRAEATVAVEQISMRMKREGTRQ